MKRSSSKIVDMNIGHVRHYFDLENTSEIEFLKNKYGEQFILNKNLIKNFKYDLDETIEYYFDKNNNIIINNYNKILYKYKYKTVESIFKETREFVEDLIKLKNNELFEPIKENDFYYKVEPSEIFYGLNERVEERNFDIEKDEFEKKVNIEKDIPKNINIKSFKKEDIHEFVEKVPKEFFEYNNILSLDMNKIQKINNSLGIIKNITLRLK